MSDKVRWGILGTGWVAHEFANGLALLPDAEGRSNTLLLVFWSVQAAGQGIRYVRLRYS